MRPRVAIVTPWYPSAAHPGAGGFVRTQAVAAARVADVVTIHLAPEPPSGAGAWEVRTVGPSSAPRLVEVRSRPARRGLGTLRSIAGLDRALRDLQTRDGWQPDVIHAHVFSAATVARIARPGLPLVVSEHASAFAQGAVTGRTRLSAQLAFSMADLVCPVSDALGDDLRRLGAGARLRTVPNSVDVDRFRPRREPRRPGPLRALVVAALVPVKGVDLAVAAAARSDGIALDVIGDGPLLEPLRRQAPETVRFLGQLPPDEVAARMRDADLLVVPSRWETQGVVVLEAMATGLPVVATRVGGLPELVDAQLGVTVEPDDADALAQGIRTLSERLDRYDAEALHARARNRYGTDAIARVWSDVYAAVSDRDGSAATRTRRAARSAGRATRTVWAAATTAARGR